MDRKCIQDMEADIRAFWERERVFEQTVERNAPRGEFVFYDGPPTANAPPGIHHVESQTFKDVIPRYKTMRGYRVRRKAGWDTHGLPVELQIEKKLRLKTKREIERYGVAKFNAVCRDSVWEFKDAWEELKHRMGFWMDMRNPYVTYEMPFVESVWWFLKQAWDKGLLTRDYKIVPWCPRCETPLSSHEVAQGYEDNVEDPSVYVRFVLTTESAARMRVPEGTAFLVWTTTPWTLPGNGALAVHPGAEYAIVQFPEKNTERAPESPSAGSETHGAEVGLPPNVQDITPQKVVKSKPSPEAGPEGNRTPEGLVATQPRAPAPGPVTTGHFSSYLILAKPLVERVLGEGAEIIQTIRGADLIGTHYEPLYPTNISPPPLGGGVGGGGDVPSIYSILSADFVSLEEGTGIVHIAPAYGAEDFELGKAHGIPPLFTVHPNGIVMDGYPGAGKFFKAADADIRVDLAARSLLFRDETVRHTYPFCWRCNTPLLYFARSSWYIAMSKLRAEIQAKNATIHWLPEHIKDGRFGEWLRELKDWAITRERYWGAPLPVWRCAGGELKNGKLKNGEQSDRVGCGHTEVIGSFADLLTKAPKRNRFILMRHGQARSNVEHRINSKLETSPQYPLTEAGRARVAAAAKQLKQAGITKIIASPFHRMRQTAEIVSATVGVPVTYDDRLREINLPDFDGKPETEFNGRFASAFEKFDTKIGANETWNELARRMLLALKDIDARHEGQTILICSHGDPLFLLRWAYSGRTREGIEGMPYLTFDDPEAFSFVGALVNDRGELDAHRPFIDGITWSCTKGGCGGVMRRFPEVVDVWLESGCMPFAQSHFPFENATGLNERTEELKNGEQSGIPAAQKFFSPSHREGEREGVGSQVSGVNGQVSPPTLYPADYISEAIDQTRGWFYTLLAVATVLGWESPYKNVIVLGHLLDAKGQKMSKSKGNVVDPIAMIDRYGADVVRWYMVAVNQPWDAKLFNEEDFKLMSRKPFGTLMNLLSFWQLHGGNTAPQWPTSNFSPSRRDGSPPARGGARGGGSGEREGEGDSGELLDSWLRARTRQTYDLVTRHLDAYELTEAARAINDLVDDLSTWWLRRSRERLKSGDASARATFTAALRSLAILLAPFTPYTAEHLFRSLPFPSGRGGGVGGGEGGDARSVHLTPWDTATPPTADGDAALLQQISEVRKFCSLGLETRAKANIPVRQPLARFSIPRFSPSHEEGEREGEGNALLDLIRDELNVKKVVIDPSLKNAVTLDTAITPELKRDGLVRELTRAVNNLRKEMGLTPTDRIRVTYQTDDAELAQAIAEYCDHLAQSTTATEWSERGAGGETSGVDRKTPDVEEPAHRTLTIASVQITLDIARS